MLLMLTCDDTNGSGDGHRLCYDLLAALQKTYLQVHIDALRFTAFGMVVDFAISFWQPCKNMHEVHMPAL